MTSMVRAEQVCKNFGSLRVLKGIDLEVAAGEVLCLVGPSGSGKSTFLRCINHLEALDGGEISVNGSLVGYRRAHGKKLELRPREIAAARRDVGMVFQRFNLFPHRTAIENVMEAPVYVKRRDKAEARKDALSLLERVGLAERAVRGDHEDDAMALGRGPCHRARGEEGLVVGVGMEGHESAGRPGLVHR